MEKALNFWRIDKNNGSAEAAESIIPQKPTILFLGGQGDMADNDTQPRLNLALSNLFHSDTDYEIYNITLNTPNKGYGANKWALLNQPAHAAEIVSKILPEVPNDFAELKHQLSLFTIAGYSHGATYTSSLEDELKKHIQKEKRFSDDQIKEALEYIAIINIAPPYFNKQRMDLSIPTIDVFARSDTKLREVLTDPDVADVFDRTHDILDHVYTNGHLLLISNIQDKGELKAIRINGSAEDTSRTVNDAHHIYLDTNVTETIASKNTRTFQVRPYAHIIKLAAQKLLERSTNEPHQSAKEILNSITASELNPDKKNDIGGLLEMSHALHECISDLGKKSGLMR